MKRTWGGIPETEAFEWNDHTKKQLGAIIGDIHSGNPARQKKGYIDYYELKRHFMVNVWDEFIDRVDNFRVQKGFLRVEAMVREIGKRVTDLNIKSNPLPKSDPPDISKIINTTQPKNRPCEKVEQMSLF